MSFNIVVVVTGLGPEPKFKSHSGWQGWSHTTGPLMTESREPLNNGHDHQPSLMSQERVSVQRTMLPLQWETKANQESCFAPTSKSDWLMSSDTWRVVLCYLKSVTRLCRLFLSLAHDHEEHIYPSTVGDADAHIYNEKPGVMVRNVSPDLGVCSTIYLCIHGPMWTCLVSHTTFTQVWFWWTGCNIIPPLFTQLMSTS